MTKTTAQTARPESWQGARTFVVERKVAECDIITSFYLAPEDGAPLPSFEPGQFLALELDIPGEKDTVRRTFTISCSPTDPAFYRLTIKREPPPPDQPDAPPGLSSNFFHDHVDVGTKINVKAPAGKFFLDVASDVPVVLLSGGVGLTPMISMVNTIVDQGNGRDVWFIHGTRGRKEHALGDHVRQLAAKNANVKTHTVYEKAGPDCVKGQHYDSEGFITLELLQDLLGGTDFEFYLCGPPAFMKVIYNVLYDWGADETRIHYEFFGPATVLREGAPPPDEAAQDSGAEDAGQGGTITFAQSGRTAEWEPKFENLLEFAEANGLAPASGCRDGICQTCMVELMEGEVIYAEDPIIPPDPGFVLICQAKPNGDVTIDI
ncbi:MAG: 2Fe-2S iron-sulfur cluster binding domain-containing protein [Rhodospirillales bacterium]|nr:2Fe-2S iron-sulfur cluster binding domain-containing protein [Rhodospirillales bacterium]